MPSRFRVVVVVVVLVGHAVALRPTGASTLPTAIKDRRDVLLQVDGVEMEQQTPLEVALPGTVSKITGSAALFIYLQIINK